MPDIQSSNWLTECISSPGLSGEPDALDAVTGLPAWHQLAAQVKNRIAASRAFSLAILDVNGLKVLNQKHGRAEGNRALAAFADHVVRYLGLLGLPAFVSRWESDRLGIVVDAPQETASLLLRGIKECICSTPDQDDSLEMNSRVLTCSLWIAGWDGQESADQLISRTEDLMWQAKRWVRSNLQATH